MNSFNYFAPTEVIFGLDTQNQAGQVIGKYHGSKVLVVYGSDRVLKDGLLDQVLASLEQANLNYELLGGVIPNPELSKVYEGIALGKQMQADFILAVGGGSVIDTAKAIAYGLAESDDDVWELFEGKRRAKSCLSIGSILTIAAAGSETSMGSVITNHRTQEKRAYDDDLSRPKFAIMNPALTLTLPDYQTQAGATDIMMHTMERYFTNCGTMDITDSIAEGLLRTVMANAKILHQDPQNIEARAEMMWAGSLSHNGLTACGNGVGGDFATHMLEHELSGMFGVTHGAGLAAIWPSWARYVYRDALPRFVKYAVEVMGVEAVGSQEEVALKGIEAMEDFYHAIGMPINMAELGITPTDEQLEEMAKLCAKASGGSKGAAKELYEPDMLAIYQMAR